MTYNEIAFQGDSASSSSSIFVTPILEAILTPTHEAEIMEFENYGTMAEHVAEKVAQSRLEDLVLTEDEARYFFKASLLCFREYHPIAFDPESYVFGQDARNKHLKQN